MDVTGLNVFLASAPHDSPRAADDCEGSEPPAAACGRVSEREHHSTEAELEVIRQRSICHYAYGVYDAAMTVAGICRQSVKMACGCDSWVSVRRWPGCSGRG
ncbi:hypothetical protein GCM10010104_50660 [Streptomyces indiaensis]|uniref:Uncharacterized protein n=1 Tax=Streptomyces indiaensis TaxID=284033 RepID=A0ABN3E3Z1_9ACTN